MLEKRLAKSSLGLSARWAKKTTSCFGTSRPLVWKQIFIQYPGSLC